MADQPERQDQPDRPDPPVPTSELDETLKGVADQTVKLLRRIIMVMGVALLAVIIVAAILVHSALTERSRVDDYLAGQCPFFYVLAALPVPSNTGAEGVNLVEGARTALVRQACPEKLPPPSAELLKLGRKFRIPIPY
jgi:hypothetical protein